MFLECTNYKSNYTTVLGSFPSCRTCSRVRTIEGGFSYFSHIFSANSVPGGVRLHDWSSGGKSVPLILRERTGMVMSS